MKSIKLVFDEKLRREVFGKSIELVEDKSEREQAFLELNDFIELNKNNVNSELQPLIIS